MLTPQNPYPPAVVATMDHRHCIDFSLPLHRRSIQCWHIILRLLAAHFFFVLCHRLLLQSLMFINATTKVLLNEKLYVSYMSPWPLLLHMEGFLRNHSQGNRIHSSL
nr:hypothetical protein CFP56_01878 [Quercus suber]